MDEQEFDAVFQQPLGTKDAARVETQMRRRMTLAIALSGRTPDDLKNQLLRPYPEIPPGFDLADFRGLERLIQTILDLVSGALSERRKGWLSFWPIPLAADSIVVGTQRFTIWEARLEIIRRAIEYLENR